MNKSSLGSIEKLESDLWEAADQLRANSKLTSSEYCMPVLGVIFLRHAANRFDAATKQIQEDQAAGRMPKRKPIAADYVKRRALLLPEISRYDYIMALPKDTDLGTSLNEAMKEIEKSFEPLAGVLPREYGIFDRTVLEDLLRIFNRDALKSASGDVFGRIYEYFLMEFAMQGAQDNGEFFTPPSIVQTIVNVIEPEHGIVFDPACGSGGMFVQSSHFIERLGQDTAKRVTFYGQEKTATTIKLAKMNLAVHGLEGDIKEANTFYQDEHTLVGKCDFVMANPPFNVDMVDAEKARSDTRRLPFGLPGVTKNKQSKKETVSNANYLWISYFHSYLNDSGRAGFVMSSQASSAGHGEKEVRRKIVQSGEVDVMIGIRSNFFYTRTVPCELWFFDKAKPLHLRDKVLMLDARSVFRKVTRKIYDFSPEQLRNLSSIVWLYRGQSDRFLKLIKDYFASLCQECERIPSAVEKFDSTASAVVDILDALAAKTESIKGIDDAARKAFAEARKELAGARGEYIGDRDTLLQQIEEYRRKNCKPLPVANDVQHAARKTFDPIAERIKGLIKQIDLIYKLAARSADAAEALAKHEDAAEHLDRRNLSRKLKELEAARIGFDEVRSDGTTIHGRGAVEQLKHAAYFHRQIAWLQDRFPDAKLVSVPGLVKVVDLKEVEAADWGLTPGRYVGVAPPEVDEDFDFEQSIKDVHVELASLNEEAAELAQKIAANFKGLAI